MVSTTTEPSNADQPPPAPGDRLTQIQDCLDKMTEMMYLSIGVLQRDAPLTPPADASGARKDVTAWTAEQLARNDADCRLLASSVARDLVRTAKVVDFLIDRLPGVRLSEEEQMEAIKVLEEENVRAGEDMERRIAEAEDLLREVKRSIDLIADEQLEFYRSHSY